jgi:hypothetical protein
LIASNSALRSCLLEILTQRLGTVERVSDGGQKKVLANEVAEIRTLALPVEVKVNAYKSITSKCSIQQLVSVNLRSCIAYSITRRRRCRLFWRI